MTMKWETMRKAFNTHETKMEEQAASNLKPSTKVRNIIKLVKV
jgi:hypothetical protein